jgi:hypothetical protein
VGEPDLSGVTIGAVDGIGITGSVANGGEHETKLLSSLRFGDLLNKMG